METPFQPRRLAAWLVQPLLLLTTTLCVLCVEIVSRDLWRNGAWYFDRGVSSGVSRALTKSAQSIMWTAADFARTFGWGPAWLWCATFAHAAFTLVFACLPHTRARAKVRPALVVRTAAYGFGFVSLVLLYTAVLTMLTSIFGLIADAAGISEPSGRWWDHMWLLLIPTWSAQWSGWRWSEPLGALMLTVAGTAWVCWYWWYAMSRGLRMKEARAAYIACVVPALLAVAIGALGHFILSYGR